MHTSQALRSSHFEYRSPGSGGRVAFSAFCAGYHEQDRVGVVSPHLEDGVLHTAYALLALTTAFYDVQRAGGSDFFIYPQHIAIIGQGQPTASSPRAENGRADTVGIATRAGCLDLTLDEAGIGGAWAWLDVWPQSNWFTAPAAPTAMLKKVFDLHINRLFWPQHFTPKPRQEQATGSGGRTRCPARLCPQNAQDAPQIRLLLQHFRADRRDLRRPVGRRDRPNEHRTPAAASAANAGARRPTGPPLGP